MSNYPTQPAGYQRVRRMRPDVGLAKSPTMKKLTLRERLGNWLLKKDYTEADIYSNEIQIDEHAISSNGMRFTLYKAAGGFVIETKIYDDRNDRNINKLHVITEEQDLGDAIGKIITMESLR